MRLIGSFPDEQQAYALYAFLLKEGIQNIYEAAEDKPSGAKEYRVWVYDENDVEKALEWVKVYQENPEDPRFISAAKDIKHPVPASPAYEEISEKEDKKWQSVPPRSQSRSHPRIHRVSFFLMRLIIALCVFIFLWNDREEAEIADSKGRLAVDLSMTPLQQNLLFDIPASYQYIQELIDTVPLQDYKDLKELPPEAHELLQKAEKAPGWKGIYPFVKSVYKQGWTKASQVPLFEKIRQGQIWRLFTPCIMHRDFLHILFNMIWAWLLLKQVEARLSRWKILGLILIIGVVSNIAQYIMGGPYFLGFSGVIVGLAAFIWTRQKKAPWEGYTLPRSTVMFLFFFVLAMLAIEIFSLILQLFSTIQIVPYIANTAHIVGGLTGLVLGRMSLFARKLS